MQLNKLFNILKIFLIFGLLVSCSQPEITLHDNKNNVIPISQLKGKWVILNYWAEWCDNCAAEMNLLNNFKQAHPKILLYGINYDHLSAVDLNKVVAKLNIKFPVLLEDPAQILNLQLADYLPMTFVLSPDGKVVKRIVGPITKNSFDEVMNLN